MQNRSKSARDPFLATGEYAVDTFILDRYIRDRSNATEKFRSVTSTRPWEKSWHLDDERNHDSICGTRSGNTAKMLMNRVAFATIGGSFLIVPMWLMVLDGELYKTLIVTTICVASFGLMMAVILEEGKDVLGSTAAYAAVLVVFVGTSNP